MKRWIRKVVQIPETGKTYFLVRNKTLFISRDINGKVCWSVKPGIAIRFNGGVDERGLLLKLAREYEAEIVEVPGDWQQRWRRRKKRF